MLASDVQGSVPESNVKWQKIFKPTKGRHLFSRVAVILLISVELLLSTISLQDYLCACYNLLRSCAFFLCNRVL